MELSSEQAMLMAAETLHLHCTCDSMYNYDDYPKLRCDFTFIGIVKGKGKRKAVHLYSALHGKDHFKALGHGSHSFTCNKHHACLTS